MRQEILHLDGASVRVVGYCLMPDHVHLVTASAGTTPGQIVQLVKGRSSRAVREVERGLAAWQDGYHDRVVRRSEGLYETLRYIFMNPVRKALVANWWEYPWSGAPLLEPLGPETWSGAPPEAVVWTELLRTPGPM